MVRSKKNRPTAKIQPDSLSASSEYFADGHMAVSNWTINSNDGLPLVNLEEVILFGIGNFFIEEANKRKKDRLLDLILPNPTVNHN
mgnify:CR=1 FL=1